MNALRGILFAVIVAASGPALAHGMLQASEPQQGAVLSKAPTQLRLRFSEALEPALVHLSLQREQATLDGLPPPALSPDGKQLLQSLPVLEPGRYRIIWNVVSRDSHRTQGEVQFRVEAP